MMPLIAVTLSCWVCALLALPRTPPRGDEVAALIHRRLLGRHHLLVALAVALTLGACLCAVVSVFVQAARP